MEPVSRRDFLASVTAGCFSALVSPTRAAERSLEHAPIPSIPGVVGFGSRSWGGNSPDLGPSKVALVTRLDDYGPGERPIPGTLRYELSQPGPKVVCLAAAGTIRLKADLEITEPYLTLTGHKAPPPGAVIANGRIIIKTHDVILSDLKIRRGDFPGEGKSGDGDCVTFWGRKDGDRGKKDSVGNIAMYRCSFAYSTDELLSTFQTVFNVTVQQCLFSRALRYSDHEDIKRDQPPGPKNHHSMGILVGPDAFDISFVENVLVDIEHRNPRVMPGEKTIGAVEWVNNIVQRFGPNKGDKLYMEPTKGESLQWRNVRVIGNLWINGKGRKTEGPIVSVGAALSQTDPKIQLYFHDNALLAADSSVVSRESGLPDKFLLKKDTVARPLDEATPVPSSKLEKYLYDRVGARTSDGKIDDHDRSILESAKNRVGGAVDTVIPGLTKRNGFPITNANDGYPRPGAVAQLHVPTETARSHHSERSPLERWLW